LKEVENRIKVRVRRRRATTRRRRATTRRIRHKQLMHDLRKKNRYWNLK
jgi:hypothetical protein